MQGSTERRKVNSEIGDCLKKARKSKKLTQSDIADKLGITRAAYAAYENGISRLSLEKFLIISQILNMNAAQIFGSNSDLFFLLAASMKEVEQMNESAAIQKEWTAITTDIVNNVNQTGQQLIMDYINVIRANPMMLNS